MDSPKPYLKYLGEFAGFPGNNFLLEIPLARRTTYQQRQDTDSKWIDKAKEKALASVTADSICMVQASIKVDFRENCRTKVLRNTSLYEADLLCVEALGGSGRGILSVAMHALPDTGAVIWNEITVFVQNHKMAQSLEKRLVAGINGLNGKITSVRTRQSTRPKISTVHRPRGSPAEAGGSARAVASTEAIKAAILQDIHATGPATFPSMTKAGLSIQWVTLPANAIELVVPQTTLAELPSFEDVMGETNRDLRKILHDADLEVTAEVLFKALIELNTESVIHMEPALDDGNQYKIWSSLRYEADSAAQRYDVAQGSGRASCTAKHIASGSGQLTGGTGDGGGGGGF